MWALYDALIEGIPYDLTVEELQCCAYDTLVKSGDGCGFCTILPEDARPYIMPKKMIGMPLRRLAECVRSWNFVEASAGLAAINAYYNAPSVAAKNGIILPGTQQPEERRNDPFIMYQNAIREKKVAVIGHFHYLDQLFRPVCDLKILSKENPQDNDYPESAAEYILPECEYVFITCVALLDKTLPRYLQAAKDAYIVIVGPSTTLSPVLIDFGANDLSGFVIQDGAHASRIVCGLEDSAIYRTGRKVSLKAKGSSAAYLFA